MHWSCCLAAGLTLAGLGCSKTQAPGAPATPGSPGTTDAAADVATSTLDEDSDAPADPRETAQWAQARDRDPEELMRLADLVGCYGLHQGASRAADPRRRSGRRRVPRRFLGAPLARRGRRDGRRWGRPRRPRRDHGRGSAASPASRPRGRRRAPHRVPCPARSRESDRQAEGSASVGRQRAPDSSTTGA